jgi:hypothetical protein
MRQHEFAAAGLGKHFAQQPRFGSIVLYQEDSDEFIFNKTGHMLIPIIRKDICRNAYRWLLNHYSTQL